MAEVHANPKQLLRYTSKYSNAPRRISTFVQEQGHHVKALLRAHMRRRGHVQVTCLLEYQKGPRGDHYTWKGEAVGDAYTFLKMNKLICLR